MLCVLYRRDTCHCCLHVLRHIRSFQSHLNVFRSFICTALGCAPASPCEAVAPRKSLPSNFRVVVGPPVYFPPTHEKLPHVILLYSLARGLLQRQKSTFITTPYLQASFKFMDETLLELYHPSCIFMYLIMFLKNLYHVFLP